MSKSNKGIRVGNYRITPLGIATFSVLIVAIIAVAILVINPFGPKSDGSVITVEAPTAEPTAIPTAVPTVEPETDLTDDISALTSIDSEMPDDADNMDDAMDLGEDDGEGFAETGFNGERLSAKIRVLGEIAIMDDVLNSVKQEDGSYDFSDVFSDISQYCGNADYTIGDVEGTLGGTMDPSGSNTKLVAPVSLINTLTDCGVDMLTLANDHALDGSFDDLMASMENLRSYGIDYVGASTSAAEKETPKIVDINGIKVGFIAYTDSLGAGKNNAGSDALTFGINLITKDTNPAKDVQACKDAGADVVIACMSWGEMLRSSASKSQRACAKVLVNAGVDVIIGYNPHVVQPVKWLQGKDGHKTLCIFCSGNLLSAVRSQPGDSGMIFQFTIQTKEDGSGYEVVAPQYIPTYVWRYPNEAGKAAYRVLNIGQYANVRPEGMDDKQYKRMASIWKSTAKTVGSAATEVYE